MDFATVRKKLGNGSYSTMEQFESDVFLICSNAMQYNATETIYHKQARAIQELARKKFQKLRFDIECPERDLKSELKTKANLLAKKLMKKPLNRTMQESLGSEFSSGATLATVGDVQSGSVPNHAVVCERPSNVEGPIEGGNSSIIENNLEKAEELSSGKDLLSKLGRRTSGVDENRRATYNLSNQPLAVSESIFSTFESEIKQLVAVGLHSEYSYARSLAHFAATLGPIAWKVASQRIQQALPPGFKFGRGWVGEYKPLSTPVLMLETHTQKESILSTKSPCTAIAPKSDTSLRSPVAAKEHPTRGPVSERKPSLLHPASVTMSERKTSSTSALAKQSSPPNTSTNQQNLRPRTLADSRNKAAKQVELNLPPSSYQHDADIVTEKQLPSNSAMPASKLREISKTMGLPQSASSKKPDKEVAFGGLSNGKITSSSLNGRIKSPSSNSAPDQMVQATKYFPKGQEKVLTDPVEAMRISAEKAQKQQKPLARSSADTSPVVPSVTSLGNESGNATVAAARAWMSLGAAGSKLPNENPTTTKNQISADSLYNPTRQFHGQVPFVQGQFPFSAGMQILSEKHSFPFQAFIRPPVSGNEGQFQNRPMIFPHLVGNDLSRLQVQSPWRGLSPHSQPKQKQESHAPDLNISFQSPGSPAKQSSSVMIDSQQPDLALQL
uniref:Bromo domain-containing protein n=2 Tax=Rhizophora mucronata TaxID=61149 RepID=A0A2P2J912_RHIMU